MNNPSAIKRQPLSSITNKQYDTELPEKPLVDKNNNTLPKTTELESDSSASFLLTASTNSNNSSCGLKSLKSKKRVQFISNEALDNSYLNEKENKHPPKHNQFVKQHSNLNNNNRSKYAARLKPAISNSSTMPSISNCVALTQQYPFLSSYSISICESDNPFRPEGSLAKEADQFVKDLKTKTEREVNDLIKNACSLNNSASLSVSELINHTNDQSADSPVKKLDTTVESNSNLKINLNTSTSTNSPIKLESPVKEILVTPPESPNKTAELNGSVKEAKKNKKVKSKCGCVLS